MIRFMPRTENSGNNQQKIARLAAALSLHPLAAGILYRRGYETPEQAQVFLKAGESALNDAFVFDQMQTAVRRVQTAVQERQSVVVFGDYDVDGICATALLTLALESIGARVTPCIPHRQSGYGLGMEDVRSFAAQGAALLITVDCGIASAQEIACARGLGIDVIITDHHRLQEVLPDALAVLHPSPAFGYPQDSMLCGAGVAAKLCEALCGRKEMLRYSDLVALATIADIVPLTGENRALVALGLKRMQKAERLGLSALCAAAGVDIRNINAGQIAYQIAPRLNASGRMEDAMQALELLTTRETGRAQELSRGLCALNTVRQQTERDIFAQCDAMARSGDELYMRRALVLSSPGWHKGVIGIVASRLSEKYYRPVLLFSEEDGVLTGSGRSIPGVDLMRCITPFAHLTERFGGHEMAAGVTLFKERYGEFKQAFNQYIEKSFPDDTFIPTQRYDTELSAAEASIELYRDLERLAPYGLGNPRPIFCMRGVAFSNIQYMGTENQHARMQITDGEEQLRAVAFSQGEEAAHVREGEKLDVLGALAHNDFGGQDRVELHVRQFMLNRQDVIGDDSIFFDAILNRILYNMNQPAAKMRQVSALCEADFRQSLRESLLKNISGTLFICADAQSARRWLGWLNAQADIKERFGLCAGTQAAIQRVYNTVLLAPGAGVLQDMRGYCRIYCAEPLLFPGECGDAEICLCASEQSMDAARRGVNAAALNRDAFASAYTGLKRALEQSRHQDLKRLAQMLGFSRVEALRCMLGVFEELGLMRVKQQAHDWELALVPNVKRPLEQSTVYQALQDAPAQLERFLSNF